MATESYTLVGSQLSPLQWVLAALLLLLIPKSYYSRRRIVPLAVIIPALGFLIAAMRVPFPYFMLVDIGGFFVGMFATKAIPPPGKVVAQPNPAIAFAYFPVFWLMLGNHSNDQIIRVAEDSLSFSQNSRTDVLPRNEVDITYEKAWSGIGWYWGVSSSKGHSGLVTTDSTYWNGHRYVGGDELVSRIEEWSRSKPRYIVNGVSDRHWVDPRGKTLPKH